MYSLSSVLRRMMGGGSVVAEARTPFRVKRTAADNIPVYTIKRFNKALIYTQVRKVRGDAETVRREISTICKTPARIIADGVIEVNGNHRTLLKEWLSGNGF